VQTGLTEREPPYAWVILAASAVMIGMAFGAMVNVSVFLAPLAAEFGWPRADIAAAYMVVGISTGLGGVVMGHYSDRLPVRRVVLIGSIVPGVAFFLLAGLSTREELYAYHALMGLFGCGAIMAPLNNNTTFWFTRNRGLAIGITSAGGALGQGLLPFLERHLILEQGWRDAYHSLGLIYLVVMIPLALLISNPPGATRLAASVSGGEGAKRYAIPRPWLIAILCGAVVFCCICMATPIVHVVSLGSDHGLQPREAAGLLTVMMIFGVAGRLATGRAADRFGNLRTYVIVSLAQTVLVLWFPHIHTLSGLYMFAALFGFGYAGVMPALLLCAREFAPLRNTGLSMGLVAFVGWIGMGIGAWQGGLFHDLNGNYVQSFLNASIAGVANLLILGLLYLYTVRWAVPALATRPTAKA